MRIIEVCDQPIRTLAVSPDGRFVAVYAVGTFAVLDWHTGDSVLRRAASGTCTQITFAPDGAWVAPGFPERALELEPLGAAEPLRLMTSTRAGGGVAVLPDGKKLAAVQFTGRDRARLSVWELPALRPRPQSEFDDWPPFQRLAFSRNGEFVAGIWSGTNRGWPRTPGTFELRFARSGGRDYYYPPMNGLVYGTPGFVSFAHDGNTCAFGWSEEEEVRVLDLSTGTGRERKYVRTPFTDASFTGSGRHFATVEDTGVLKLWDVSAWQVAREYDWQCGPLTALAFTADGSAGVCGTIDGKLVQFDVDE